MNGKVYLAGPITGLTFDGADDWRRGAKEFLAKHDIQGISPLRAKEYLRDVGVLKDQYHELNVLSSGKGITTRDRWDATRCDLVLANFVGAEWPSIGTVMECAWADLHRVPLVVAADAGNVHDHAMLREVAGFWVPTLEDALQLTVSILEVR